MEPEDSSSPIKDFFARSDWVDREVLRPLDHIFPNWELTWDPETDSYFPEEDSFARLFNQLIEELADASPPLRYHDNEDRLAEYVKKHLKWNIHKAGNRWVGEDYDVILQQGGFDDVDQADLVLAAAGRIKAAIDRGQTHFDKMEESHQKMLSSVLAVILYHRFDL